MATPKQEDILSFGIGVDIRESLKAIERFQREMVDTMKAISKSTADMGKAATKASEDATEAAEDQEEAVKDVSDAYKEQMKIVGKYQGTIEELQKRLATASEDEKEGIQDNINLLKKQIEVLNKKATAQEKAGKKGKKGGKRPGDELLPSKKTTAELRASLKEAGEDLKKPLESFLARDAKGLVENSFKGVGGIFKGAITSLRLGGRAAKSGFGTKPLFKGAQESAGRIGAGFKIGKATGGMKGAMGGGMKAMGGEAMKGISSAMKGLAKLGPALGVAAGAIAGLVKLFLDADSMVKDFNKSVMQSASNMEFLANAQGHAGRAAVQLEDALGGISDAAMDYQFNTDWGITKDEHAAVLNVLQQEGVALGHLAEQAGGSRKEMEKLSKSLVATGVTYSRALGVPLQEINQLQAEMMTEMGMSAEDTKTAFAHIGRSAADSGIAANKFFSMIRGVSQDLSLWNFRMTESVDLLGKLGKVMSPRSAQKFFQELSSGFKNMGRQDLLKQGMFAGKKALKEGLKIDFEAKTGDLAKTLVGATIRDDKGQLVKLDEASAKKFAEANAGDYDKLDRAIRTLPKKAQGVAREQSAQLERLQQGIEGGMYEASQASGEISSVPAQLKIMVGALERFGGDLLKPNKMNLAVVAENLNVSREQANALHGMLRAAESQRTFLRDALQAEKNGEKLTQEQSTALEKMRAEGIKEGDLTRANFKNNFHDIMKTMDQSELEKETKKQKTVQESIADLAKDQGQLTQSFMQKFEVLMDWFMNKFYNIMLDIWDAVASIGNLFGGEDRKLKKDIYRSQNQELIDAFDKAVGKDGSLDKNVFKDLVAGGALGGKLTEKVATEEGRAAVSKAVGQHAGGQSILNMASQAGLDPQVVESLKKALTEEVTMKGRGRAPEASWTKLKSAGNIDLEAAMAEAGLSAEEQQKLLNKALHGVAGSPEALAGIVGDANLGGGRKAANMAASDAKVAVASLQEKKDKEKEKEKALVGDAARKEQLKASMKADPGKVQKVIEKEKELAAFGTGGGGAGDAVKEGLGVSEKQVEELASIRETQEAQGDMTLEELQSGNSEISKALNKNYRFFKSDMAKEIEEGTLSALRQGLYEYYLYSGIEDRSKVAEAFGRVGGPGKGAEMLAGKFKGGEGSSVEDSLSLLRAPANAAGGIVSGVNGGLAMVTAAAGEGLASVGAGERIVPAGGGAGGGVTVNVQGVGGRDLANLIEGKVVEGIREYKRREKYY